MANAVAAIAIEIALKWNQPKVKNYKEVQKHTHTYILDVDLGEGKYRLENKRTGGKKRQNKIKILF